MVYVFAGVIVLLLTMIVVMTWIDMGRSPMYKEDLEKYHESK